MTNASDHTNQGFTLIELMIAAALTFLVIGYTMETFSYQHKTYVVVDQVSEAQQNTRALATLMERDVRVAGYYVSPSAATCGIDNTGAPDVIYLTDSEVILPPDELAANFAAAVLGAEVVSITGGTPDTIRVDDLVIDGDATHDTDSNGTADSDFRVGGGVIIIDEANPELGVLCGTITAIGLGSSPTISANLTNTSWSGTPLNSTDIHAIPAHVYQVTGTNPPALRRNGDILAKDVEDLQVAWFMDADADNEVDGNEYDGDVTTNVYDPRGQDGAELREIRMNLVLRTRGEDPRNPDLAGRGQGTENRATSVAGADGRRRRVHSATVRVRNVPAL